MLAAIAGRIYHHAPQQNAFPLDRQPELPIRTRSKSLFLVLVLQLALASCTDVRPLPSDRGSKGRLSDYLERNPSATVDFVALAPFAWSRMFVFGSYSTQEQAERTLGFEWRYRWPLGVQDGEALVVFVDSARVVAAFEATRSPVNFLGVTRRDGYPRDSARFRVVRDSTLEPPGHALAWPPEPAV